MSFHAMAGCKDTMLPAKDAEDTLEKLHDHDQEKTMR